MQPFLLFERDGAVVTLTMNRPASATRSQPRSNLPNFQRCVSASAAIRRCVPWSSRVPARRSAPVET